jgi:putative hydrolase of the HAD superfamily
MRDLHFVFDFGVVLFRWRPTVLLQSCLPQHAVDEASAQRLAEAIFQGYGGDWGEFDRGSLQVSELVARISRRTGLREADVLAVVQAVPDELQPLPESEALVHRLHAAGRPMYYLSNMPGPYADHLERTHAVLGCFADGVFSARVGLAKPDAAIFELAARRFGRSPAELVFLDDHPANVSAAQAAGWNALHFRHAAQAEAELRELGWWPAHV